MLFVGVPSEQVKIEDNLKELQVKLFDIGEHIHEVKHNGKVLLATLGHWKETKSNTEVVMVKKKCWHICG